MTDKTIDTLIHNMVIERLVPVVQEIESIKENGAKVDLEALKAELLAAMPKPSTVTLKVTLPDGATKKHEGAHPEIGKIAAKLLSQRPHDRNLYIWGPAGTGKTTIAEYLAEKVIDSPLHVQGVAMSKYDIFGFKLPSGDIVRTAFMDAWQHGGVWLLDDGDRSDPKALAALNAATANGIADFSHCGLGTIPRHPDCIIIVTGNTPMNGQSAAYSAASRQDGAFRDRFTFHHLAQDEAFEREITPHLEWTKRVQRIRAAVAEIGDKAQTQILATMRASFQGAALLATGQLTQAEIEDAVIFKGVADDLKGLVYGKAGKPSTACNGSLLHTED